MTKEFYNGQFVLTKHKTWNFLLGNRNAGKSFLFKNLCIKRFLQGKIDKNPRNCFCLFHRKVDDVKLTSPGFFDDVLMLKYPDKVMTFKPSTNGFGRFYLDGELCGYSLCIKNYVSYKKMAELQRITTIIFDEFLSEDDDYLKNEVDAVRNIYSTIARGGGEHIRTDVQMFFISNTVSVVNPYFEAFPDIKKRMRYNTRKLVGETYVLEMYMNEDAMNAIKSTEFGRSLEGTSYGAYIMNNDFYCDNNKFIEHVKGEKDYVLTYTLGGKDFAVYSSVIKGVLYISRKIDPCEQKFVFDNDDHDVNYLMFTRKENTIKGFKRLYEKGAVRFEDLDCKISFLALISVK